MTGDDADKDKPKVEEIIDRLQRIVERRVGSASHASRK